MTNDECRMRRIERSPLRPALAWSLALAALWGTGGLAFGQVARSGTLELWVDKEWPLGSPGGYIPLRVSIRNAGPERTLRVELRAMHPETLAATIGKSVAVGEGQTAAVTLVLPALSDYNQFLLSVHEDGRAVPGLSDTVVLPMTVAGDERPLLIISDRNEDLRTLTEALSRIGGPSVSHRGSPPLRQIQAAQMPEGWVSYTQVGVIGASARAVEMMSPAQRDDLRKWVAAGGTLFIYRPVGPGGDPAGQLLGEKSPAPPAGRRAPDATRCYFGLLQVLRDDPFAWEGPWNWEQLLASLGYREASFKSRFGFGGHEAGGGRGGYLLKVPGVGEPPVRAYAAIVTLFALAIGPVNYFLLRRKKKLYLLFVVTPLAALAVTLGMILYGLLYEGLEVKATIGSVTWLDQERHEAVTLGRMAFYAGSSLRGGLLFPREVAAFPAAGDMSPGSLDLDEGHRFQGGWVRPRTLLNYVTAGIGPARGRLAVRRSGEQLTLTNGLGVGIRRIHLMDAQGRLYGASLVPDGGSVVLTRLPSDSNPPQAGLGLEPFTHIPLVGQLVLRKGMFLVELESSPFFLTGMQPAGRRVTEQGSRHVLYGRFTEEADGHRD